MSIYRGSVALVLAITLGTVLVVVAVAAAFGVHISDMMRTAAIAAIGVLVGALATYLAKQ